ncbi:hypothetical protein DRE_02799 [Drechslerella stenobrocha 248]|uniref:Uncharacterized protein n=1 Tax=Drechslerella stenobrocha 248 TaxID=1043628 RepID=W7I612_9PEZI|nr:hypothetical protein DRE_02799 [Drechslerella stenobrocha 248]
MDKGQMSMNDIWAEAAKEFERICKKSPQKGGLTFDDVLKTIEKTSSVSYGNDSEEASKWDKAKRVGLQSLEYLKVLTSIATQAAEFVPVPPLAVTVTSNALSFVFNIPTAVKGYNDAVDEVFSKVSVELLKFKIYTSIEKVGDDDIKDLVGTIYEIMVSFVKLCAHVVNFRQSRLTRFVQQAKYSILKDDSDLRAEMTKFEEAVKRNQNIVGTVTLKVVVDIRNSMATLVDQTAAIGETTEGIDKSLRGIKGGLERNETLDKIRDVFGIPAKLPVTYEGAYKNCLEGTGRWIWNHSSYVAWKRPEGDSHALLVLGCPSSGKTSTCALIAQGLGDEAGQGRRTFVAHYFFPPDSASKKSEDKRPLRSALLHMAFRVAQMDPTFQKSLSETCDAGLVAKTESNLQGQGTTRVSELDTLWDTLKIGAHGLGGGTYYLIFDGLEHLPENEARTLLSFIFGPKLAASAGRVRVMASTTNKLLDSTKLAVNNNLLIIQMEECNEEDMRIVARAELNKPSVNIRSIKRRMQKSIIQKLLSNSKGSYSNLHYDIEDVIRSLKAGTSAQDLMRLLNNTTNRQKRVIERLQQSLQEYEIKQLNELLKWVIFSHHRLTFDEIEAAMFLYSGKESLADLKAVIEGLYSDILIVKGDPNEYYVQAQEGIRDYLQKSQSRLDKDRATISMTITINNVDPVLCQSFLWDLTHKITRDNFKFDLNTASSKTAIEVDEFDAHRTIVARMFDFLGRERRKQSHGIGSYVITWLPHHLGQLRKLEYNEKGVLTQSERSKIGQGLYELFRDARVFRCHKEFFSDTYWTAAEMRSVWKWLMDWSVIRELDQEWRDEMDQNFSPTSTFLKSLVEMVVEGFLKGRSWDLDNAFSWIEQFMLASDPKFVARLEADDAWPNTSPYNSNASPDDIETTWQDISNWCQSFLGLEADELGSLWYERLADTWYRRSRNNDTVEELYNHAISRDNPSWRCYRGLGKTLFRQGQLKRAIEQVELALEKAQQEGATPKAEGHNIISMHLLLGRYNYKLGEMSKAEEHYRYVYDSKDPETMEQGRLGVLKAILGFLDEEKVREWLTAPVGDQNDDGSLVNVLKMIARDDERYTLFTKMFIIAEADPDLLQRIMQAMEAAVLEMTPQKDAASEGGMSDDGESEDGESEDGESENWGSENGDLRDGESEDEWHEDQETKYLKVLGTLLYHRGAAACWYNVSPGSTEEASAATSKAVELWVEGRRHLLTLDSPGLFEVRQQITRALAMQYFQSMRESNNLFYKNALLDLATDDSSGFLTALHAMREEKEEAKKPLASRMTRALGILSDNLPDNDALGFAEIYKISSHYQDFKNAAIALSLLVPSDIVTHVLFSNPEVVEIHAIVNNLNPKDLKSAVAELVKKITDAAIAQAPDIREQVSRIEAAFKWFMDPEYKVKEEVDGPNDQYRIDHVARTLLTFRMVNLHQRNTPKINTRAFMMHWACSSCTPNGKRCEAVSDFEREFYRCTFCWNVHFCRHCLDELRKPGSNAKITVCSPTHQWLRIPPLGDAMYVGPWAETVRVPTEVRPVEGGSVWEICYDENSSVITVEAWKEELAEEWEVEVATDTPQGD